MVEQKEKAGSPSTGIMIPLTTVSRPLLYSAYRFLPELHRNIQDMRTDVIEPEFTEGTDMIAVDGKGNELLDIIDVSEADADKKYGPVNHCLAVVKTGDDYLMGWNQWRKDWEIFGGCREGNETLRECIARECKEELGLDHADFTYLGLMHYKLAPGYFNPEWHEEYGGLYGITLPKAYLPMIEEYRNDREEIEKLALYRDIKGREEIAVIDEKLLEYWK